MDSGNHHYLPQGNRKDCENKGHNCIFARKAQKEDDGNQHLHRNQRVQDRVCYATAKSKVCGFHLLDKNTAEHRLAPA